MAQAADHRRATAERNVEAILDAVEALLTSGAAVSTTAVAAAAGVSRVTVYAHFPTREAMLEAVAERAVRRVVAALEQAGFDEGPAMAALERLVDGAWQHLDRHPAIVSAAARQLSPDALQRAHATLRERLGALVRRGQAGGEFRDDVPVDWLVSTYIALVHACGDDVRAGRLEAADAPRLLKLTLRDVFAGRR